MGRLEAKEGGSLIGFSCEERMGKPEELGFALAMVADERNGYLAGVTSCATAAVSPGCS